MQNVDLSTLNAWLFVFKCINFFKENSGKIKGISSGKLIWDDNSSAMTAQNRYTNVLNNIHIGLVICNFIV